jgi:hypothetical protein
MTGAALGGMAAAVGGRSAAALTSEPMPAGVKAAFALACKSPNAGGGGHTALIANAQAALKQEIAAGTAKTDTRRSRRLPDLRLPVHGDRRHRVLSLEDR